MAQLGTLTAGLAHELGNPVAAVSRGAGGLRDAVVTAARARSALGALDLTPAQQAWVEQVERRLAEPPASTDATRPGAAPDELDAMSRADREERLEEWLELRSVDRPWEVAAALASAGFDAAWLARATDDLGPDRLPVVLAWLDAAATLRGLLDEVARGASRVAETVAALKSYVYLDQAPVQDVDVRRGLDDTIFFLRGKLGPDVVVDRAYDPDLPLVPAFGSDLNQVWTTVIDNAADAVGRHGRIAVRAHAVPGQVVVEVENDGPGIPPEHLPRLFDPFFTTKPPGSGAGLGLTICYQIVERHHGDIRVSSEAGRTVVTIALPLGAAI
jgi:signal transduction histidine kinase